MPDVVALALPGGPGFVRAIEQVWAAGDAIFPLDPRLPTAERDYVLTAVAPGAIIESDGARRSIPGGQPSEPGDAVVVATSGTTGQPKGVVLTHDALKASADATHQALDVDPTTDKWLACLPLSHIGGLAVITRSLLSGMEVEVHDGFDPVAVTAAVRRDITLTSLVTRALVQVPVEEFRMILLGGAAPPPHRPANVWATYGLAETASGCVYERTALQGVEIRIDDQDEVWLRGPMLLRAYRNANDSVLHHDPKDSDGWFPTDDLGRFGDDGELLIDGRKGDVINTGGEKVWPDRTERVLLPLPGVLDVAVIGRPHPEWGQEVVALVVSDPAESEPVPDLDQMRDAVRAELPVWYAPRSVELIETLPRTALGKLQRSKLRT